MKIHTLEITGFGPFAATETIDFEALEQSGVFLLTGPTGSGKTTVLDAICFALYGKLPRSGGKQPDPASHYRDPATTPRVVLDVTFGGRRLRVNRVPKHKRPAKRGGGLTADGNTVALEELDGDGQWKPVSTALAEANAEIEAVINMDAGQFSQVVMLPQGEFATFLKATVDQRRKLLERLFPTQDLAYVEDWLKRRSQETAKTRNDKLEEISHCLVAGNAVIEGLLDDEDEPLAPRPEALDGPRIPEWVAMINALLAKRRETAQAAETKTRAAVASAQAEHSQREKRAGLVAKRIQAEAKLAALLADRDLQSQRSVRIAAAERARSVSPLVRMAASKATEKLAAETSAASLAKRLDAEAEVRDRDPLVLQGQAKALQSQVTTLSNFESNELVKKRGLTEKISSAKAELEILAGTDSGPGAELADAETALKQANEQTRLAKENLIEIRKARTAGMAAELAGRLEPGEPCMVCGSTEHPSPAVALEHAPTEADEKVATQAVPAAEKVEAGVAQAREDLKLKLESRRIQLRSELDSATRILGELDRREAELLAGATTIGERRQRLENLVELITEALAAGSRLEAASEAHAAATAAAEAEAEANGFESVRQAGEAVLEDQALADLKAASKLWQDGLAATTAQLEEGEVAGIDPGEVIPLDETAGILRQANLEHEEAQGHLTTWTDRINNFAAQTRPLDRLREELVPIAEEAKRAGELANLANGKNQFKMELSIYVLAARLKQVIEAANRRLEPMSNGQYQLVYSGELIGSGAASGLGIQVHDSHTSATRETVTLSGGESFYASLALALGLAEVVQRETGGRPLETLFIDEGFGTLDPQTLDQVMNEIDSLRENGRTVGLVSHVEELRNRIPTQIRVTSGRDGSHLEVTGT